MEWSTATIRVPAHPLLTLREVCACVRYGPRRIKKLIEIGQFPRPVSGKEGREQWSAMSIGVWLAWLDYAGRPLPEDKEKKPPARKAP